MNYKIKDLLKLPERHWSKETVYKSIALVPTGKKHDSGYALIAIVGFNEKQEPFEIAAYCDDVCYAIPENIQASYKGFKSLAIRTDMYYPSGITHVWSWYFEFKVGTSLSSTDVYLIPLSPKPERKEGEDVK